MYLSIELRLWNTSQQIVVLNINVNGHKLYLKNNFLLGCLNELLTRFKFINCDYIKKNCEKWDVWHGQSLDD